MPKYMELHASRHTAGEDKIETAMNHLKMLVQTTARMYEIDWAALYKADMRNARNACTGSLRSETTAKFAQLFLCYEALKFAGLDILGSIEQLYEAQKECVSEKRGFLMAAILVVDAEKAETYIHLGSHIGTDIVEHPETLEEAADAYTDICWYVGKDDVVGDVTEAGEDEASTELIRWLNKRQAFRVETRKRYRQILVDMAREEWMEEQVSAKCRFGSTG